MKCELCGEYGRIYIDEDGLCMQCSSKIKRMGYEKAKLRSVRESDVVEVVRCGECKYFTPWNKRNQEYYCSNHKGLHQMVTGDQFCSQGEMKTNYSTN